jgi:superfamily I DNA/RNA helicase/mRNA-degrading endonuclease RelE of RelBE toxin-antitoxin system
MSRRQLTIKPTCMREIAAFPSDRAGLLWDKIDQLVGDPLPDGKVKKKLKGADGVYRLRVAEHRVFYRFGEDWVSLLSVRRRQEDTYEGLPSDAVPANPAVDADDDDLDAILARAAPRQFQFKEAGPVGQPLASPITPALLKELGVPAAAVPVLVACATEDALMNAAVPADVLGRVLDRLYPPTLDRLDQQPDLVVPSTRDLVRYKDGDLLGFLLRLDEDQVKLTRWALDGPTMVRGGAGTGKSTVALYRVKALLERPGATGHERVLFTTYTRALLTVTRQLLEQLLTPDQLRRVEVVTCDQLAHRIVARLRKVGAFETDSDALRRLGALRRVHQPGGSAFEAKLRARALDRLTDAWLLEEFDWIIAGRGLKSLSEYLDAARPGRGLALPERGRTAVWELYEAFAAQAVGERYPALRLEALAAARGAAAERFDHVVVDEAQDLSPVSLALLAECCAAAEGLFFAADSKQSLYSRNYGWASAHPRLQFRGRTALLRRNYRSTSEIDAAAFSVLAAEEGDDMVASASVHSGPEPVLLRLPDDQSEAEWVARFVRQMARHLHLKASAAAVLVPGAQVGEALAEGLRRFGLGARFFPGRELDLKADVVRVLTLHAAKGLEFPIVVVAGMGAGAWPVPEDFDEPSLFEERARHERRLLYVGLSRAMRGLMWVVPRGCRHPALATLDISGWHVEEVE